ncbi:MAG: MazG nucleotide pyrophosphohydrolase domain-containing protein [Peptococcaceae bacterium]|nr:MazG nucleotide pyrophosphohydrolase domain-containing protein [Peptococcaceae bacterium]
MNEEGYRKFVMNRHYAFRRAKEEAALGLASEAGEVAQLVRKEEFEGESAAVIDVAFELADVLHYVMLLSTHLGMSLAQLWKLNVFKLKEREAGREEDALQWLHLESRSSMSNVHEVMEAAESRRKETGRWPWE